MKQAPSILSCIESAMDMLHNIQHPTAYVNDDDVAQVLYMVDRLVEEAALAKSTALSNIANKMYTQTLKK